MTILTLALMIIFFVFIIGVCVGSFLNVVILRAFSEESIVLPPSKCPTCQKPLKWYHNIPIFSYIFLQGKCAFCKEPISIQYPIVELVTGLLFVAIFWHFGLTLNALFMLIFVSLFIVLSVTDIKEKVVFDFHTYILVATGLIYNLFNIGNLYAGDKVFAMGSFSLVVNNSIIASILGVLLGIIIMEAFARFGYLVAGTRAFGEGDTYIAAGLGAVFGWKYLISVLLWGFVVQIVLTVPVFIKKLFDRKDYKTMISFFVFFILIITLKWLDNASPELNMWVFTVLALLLCSVGIYLCRRILGGLKDKENMTYLPFGPALAVGGLIMIFLL